MGVSTSQDLAMTTPRGSRPSYPPLAPLPRSPPPAIGIPLPGIGVGGSGASSTGVGIGGYRRRYAPPTSTFTAIVRNAQRRRSSASLVSASSEESVSPEESASPSAGMANGGGYGRMAPRPKGKLILVLYVISLGRQCDVQCKKS